MALTKLKSSNISADAVTANQLAPGAVTVADIPDNEISMAKLSQVNLAIAPEVLGIQVDGPAAGVDVPWIWTWQQSTLPYARRTITNSPELQVPLYKQGTYVIDNFAAYDVHDAMTQVHGIQLKWIDGAGSDNVVSWSVSSGPVTTTHASINGGSSTQVQRLTVNVPTTVVVPTLNLPTGVTYTVANSGTGAYAFTNAANGSNPNIGPLYRGATYTFNVTATGHPFYLTTDNGTNFVAASYFGEYTAGVTNSRTETGSLTFIVPANAPDTLYYQCGNHSAMRGAITVKELAVETNNNGNLVIYAQHSQEGMKTPVEIRPIPSLVNQMCLVYDASSEKFVPQDLATYVENTPSFRNKIQEVAGTATLVAADGTAVVASVNVYSDSTYLPLVGNNAGDLAFATDNNSLYIWDATAWQVTKARTTDELAEGSVKLYYTDERVDDRVAALIVGGNNITATYNDSAGTLTIDGQPGYADSDVASYLAGTPTGSVNFGGATSVILPTGSSDPAGTRTAGELFFNTTTGVFKYYDGSYWKKVSFELTVLSSVSGIITKATASNINLTGTGFLSSSCDIIFTVGGTDYTVTKTADNNTTISNVAVPAAVYNSAVGTTVSIKVTNSDLATSEVVLLAVIARPSVLSSVSGTIYNTVASNITLTGTGFLSSSCVVTFTVSGSSYTVTKTADNNTTISNVAVPAAVYNSAGGTSVAITVTNIDSAISSVVSTTILALPAGGTITTASGYRIHTFTSSGAFVVDVGAPTLVIDLLLLAGGAGGGARGGGGGAGGLIEYSSISVTAGSYSIGVGAGGAASTDSSQGGSSYNGNNSTAFGNTATGGGRGGNFVTAGGSGGSGGGGGRDGGAGGSGIAGQGNAGGASATAGCSGGAGGGGKASGPNFAPTYGSGNERGGNGGSAYQTTFRGSSETFAGGGGGGTGCSAANATSYGLGGGTSTTSLKGGGGDGAVAGQRQATHATGSTGGGGGASGDGWGTNSTSSYISGQGGSGIVIIRYAF